MMRSQVLRQAACSSATILDASGYTNREETLSKGLNTLLSAYVANSTAATKKKDADLAALLCVVNSSTPLSGKKATSTDNGSEVLQMACASLNLPCLSAVGAGSSSSSSSTAVSSADLVAGATSALREFNNSLSLDVLTSDPKLVHYLLSKEEKALAVKNMAKKMWTKDLLLAAEQERGTTKTEKRAATPIADKQKVQFAQLLDYWALQQHEGFDPAIIRKLLARFETLENVEAYCASAPIEQQQRLLTVLHTARDLRLQREALVPSVTRAEPFLTLPTAQVDATASAASGSFAETLVYNKMDLSNDAVNTARQLGVDLKKSVVDAARALTALPPFIPVPAAPKKEAQKPAPEFAVNSELFSDDELFNALAFVQEQAAEKQKEASELKTALRATKEITKNPYLDFIANEFNRFVDVFDAENPVTATPLPMAFFEALRNTNIPSEAVHKLLDEAVEQVALMDPVAMGMEAEKFVSFFDMLDEASFMSIDFGQHGQRFSDFDKTLTPSQMLAQRLIAATMPYTARGASLKNPRATVAPIRDALAAGKRAPRSTGFEPWHTELLKQIHIPTPLRRSSSSSTNVGLEGQVSPSKVAKGAATSQAILESNMALEFPDLADAVRDISYQMHDDVNFLRPRKAAGSTTPSPLRGVKGGASKKGENAAPRLIVLHLNQADVLFLSMLNVKDHQFSRSTAVKSFAGALTALFEAKQRLMFDNVILVPVITGLSTNFCPELETLDDSHWANRCLVEQLRCQDPRTPCEIDSATGLTVSARERAANRVAKQQPQTDAEKYAFAEMSQLPERELDLAVQGHFNARSKVERFVTAEDIFGQAESTSTAPKVKREVTQSTPKVVETTRGSLNDAFSELLQDPADPAKKQEKTSAPQQQVKAEKKTKATLAPTFVPGFATEKDLASAAQQVKRSSGDLSVEENQRSADRDLAESILEVGSEAAAKAASKDEAELVVESIFREADPSSVASSLPASEVEGKTKNVGAEKVAGIQYNQ